MSLAPLLHAQNIGGSAELIAVARFAQPTPLAGGLAGETASRLAAITLMLGITVIREEKLIAITALALLLHGVHRETKPAQSGGKIKQNNRREEEPKGRRKKSFSSE